jgi:hypothetical protein
LAVAALTEAITVHSESVNSIWPFFQMPSFAFYAQHAMKLSGAEMVWFFNTVPHGLREEYVRWMNGVYYDRVVETNMYIYGDLSRMPDKYSYVPNITWKTDEGFVPDIERDYYYATSDVVPPPDSFKYVPETMFFHSLWKCSTHQSLFSVWNWNVNSVESYIDILRSVVQLRNESLWTNVRPYTTAGMSFTPEQHAAMQSNRKGSQPDQPHSLVFRAVFRSLHDDTSDIVAAVTVPVAWDVPLQKVLPETSNGINVVLRNTCNQSFTYLLNGPDASYIGEGDLHEKTYDELGMSVDLWESNHPDYLTVGNHGLFSSTVYPTVKFQQSHESNTPKIYATVIAGTFLLMIAADLIVQRRNQKLVKNAARSNAIVSSLFHKNVRDRVVALRENDTEIGKVINTSNVGTKSAPIADLHLESTIMFADVVGFTAWSSVWEPVQVFTLLETLYDAFDKVSQSAANGW